MLRGRCFQIENFPENMDFIYTYKLVYLVDVQCKHVDGKTVSIIACFGLTGNLIIILSMIHLHELCTIFDNVAKQPV